jgi:hypothetical protein
MSVPPPPQDGLALDAEIRHRVKQLPEAMRNDHAYNRRDLWCGFLAWEYNTWQASMFRGEF